MLDGRSSSADRKGDFRRGECLRPQNWQKPTSVESTTGHGKFSVLATVGRLSSAELFFKSDEQINAALYIRNQTRYR